MNTPRIVTYRLRNYLDASFVEDPTDPVYTALQDTAHEVDGDDVVTEPMLATSDAALVFAASPAIDTDITARYALWVTRSPERCDGFGTMTVTTREGFRLVAIVREHEAWQLSRYDGGVIAMEAA